jgi:hypothetical protein
MISQKITEKVIKKRRNGETESKRNLNRIRNAFPFASQPDARQNGIRLISSDAEPEVSGVQAGLRVLLRTFAVESFLVLLKLTNPIRNEKLPFFQ